MGDFNDRFWLLVRFLISNDLHSLNLKLCCKQNNKKFLFHLIVAPQQSSGWRHNYSTKTRQACCANKQSMYSLVSMFSIEIFSAAKICLINWKYKLALRLMVLNVQAQNIENGEITPKMSL
jgi:hypothetical protein